MMDKLPANSEKLCSYIQTDMAVNFVKLKKTPNKRVNLSNIKWIQKSTSLKFSKIIVQGVSAALLVSALSYGINALEMYERFRENTKTK